MTEGFRSLTEEQEIVRAVDGAIEELNRAVSRANEQGFFIDFEATEFRLMGRPFPYYTFSATIYKRMLVDKPDETKL